MTFAATWMDLETVILSEVKHMKSLTYGSLEKKMILVKLFTEQKKTHRHRNETYGCQRGKGWEKDKLGVWD